MENRMQERVDVTGGSDDDKELYELLKQYSTMYSDYGEMRKREVCCYFYCLIYVGCIYGIYGVCLFSCD